MNSKVTYRINEPNNEMTTKEPTVALACTSMARPNRLVDVYSQTLHMTTLVNK